MPTSADPRVASENFTAERLAAIVTVSGRLIAPLSRHPDEQEIAILPGTLLLAAGSVAVQGSSMMLCCLLKRELRQGCRSILKSCARS
jgi:hypothetical protein